MRGKIIFMSLVCAFMSCKSYCNNSQQDKIDSLFTYHFSVLDSIANNNFIDSTLRCIESIQFMELNTKISSSTDGNYFGKTSFTIDDLKAWHKWYTTNKEKLYWCEEDEMIKVKEARH